jgi:hypothetical protein
MRCKGARVQAVAIPRRLEERATGNTKVFKSGQTAIDDADGKTPPFPRALRKGNRSEETNGEAQQGKRIKIMEMGENSGVSKMVEDGEGNERDGRERKQGPPEREERER